MNCKSGELLHAFGIEHGTTRSDAYVAPDVVRVEGVRRRRDRLLRPLFRGKLGIKRWR